MPPNPGIFITSVGRINPAWTRTPNLNEKALADGIPYQEDKYLGLLEELKGPARL